MKRVLIITYYWVPAGGVAVQRFLKFSKYLRDFGWEPVILTVENGSYPYTDARLQEQVPQGLEVHRTKTFEPFELYNLLRGQKGKAIPLAVATDSKKSFFQKFSAFVRANYFLPDARVGWKPYAIREASKIIGKGGIDAIITTGPPHSTHLSGQALKKKFNLPWIADFRDPWTEIFNNQYLPFTKHSIARDKEMEASVLRDCDAATIIGNGMKTVFPQEFTSKMVTITNGYDEEDYDRNLKPASDKFTMRYTGNLFSNQNVPAFWQAIAELRNEQPDFCRDFELEITGRADSAIGSSIEEAGIKEAIRFCAFVPHREAIAKMQTAALLLSVIPDVPNNHLIITGKIFEYIGAHRPVFLIAPYHSDPAQIISEAGCGEVHHYTEKDKMKSSLLNYYRLFQSGAPEVNNISAEKYERRQLTGKLAGLLERLTS